MAAKKTIVNEAMTSAELIEILREEFPPEKIQKRKGSWNPEKKAYDEYTYVAAEDITERLNKAFGLAWSLELSVGNELPSFVIEDTKKDRHVVVAAVIEYVDPDSGQRFRKTGFGGKKITADLGNDFKGCLSKAMSNAAKKMGVAVVGDDDVVIPEDTASAAGEEKKGGVVIGGKGVAPSNPPLREQDSKENNDPNYVAHTTIDTPAPAKKGIGVSSSTTPSVEKEQAAPKKGISTNSAPVATEKKEETKAAQPAGTKYDCADCSGEIVSAPTTDGKVMEPKDIANISKTFFKRQLCNRCMKVAKEKMKQDKATPDS